MHPSRTSRGFTLIELLTVIAIIAILMGLLLPVLNSAKTAARKTEAKSDIANIVAAVRAYYADYGQYPISPNGPPGFTGTTPNCTYGDTASQGGNGDTNDRLFNILRAIPSLSGYQLAENPRLVVYIDVPFSKDPTNPKEGIIPPTGATGLRAGLGSGMYVDPWGNQYNVRLDNAYTNSITLKPPYTNTPSPGYTIINTGVVAWSYGPNGVLGDGQSGNAQSAKFDDILSWQ